MVLSEGYRGVFVLLDVTLDRILVPVAILVALAGAALIGVQISDMIVPDVAPAYQL
jgi:hypothetical protein